MFWGIFVILAILWLLGLINSYYLVGFNSVILFYYILKDYNQSPWGKYHEEGRNHRAE